MVRLWRAPSFDHYVVDVCDRLHQLGGVPVIETTDLLIERQILLLSSNVTFVGEDLELKVFEVLRKTQRDTAHREKYCYRCRLDQQLVFRYERDPLQHPEMPDHKHLSDGTRIPCEISVQKVLGGFWDEVAAEKRRRDRVRLELTA